MSASQVIPRNSTADGDTLRNPQNETAIQAVNAFANHLAARFNPIVGCTRSWDSADPTDFQVRLENNPYIPSSENLTRLLDL